MSEKLARRRVKLYALNNERQWDDRGTGHVTYVDRLKGISLLVRAELDGTPLLESKIQTDTAYQKQQGTLIVWSERDNFDLALSFQEKAGCDEIWEKICQVQGKDPSVEVTQDVVDESEEERFEDGNDSAVWIENLPPVQMDKIENINELISSSLHNTTRREKLALAIENEGYIGKLLEVFRVCEDLENQEALHHLYEIFKNIFLLNKNSLLDVLFSDENIFDVIGALEYDPAYPVPKKHREFLKSTSVFKEVIPLENADLVNKIHQTHRIQYIQDVALPTQTVFEENVPSTLTSYIYFNKVEIVTLIQDDERFLSELFVQLSSEDVSIDKKRDLILFLKEFCTFSQTLQPPNRENFYKTLSSFGVLGALECTIPVDDYCIKSASVDILGFFVEFSPSMVRDYMMQQQHKVNEEHLLMNIMLEQMVLDIDPEMGGAVQLMGILRILIDPENMLAAASKAERTDFLPFFYKHCMHFLIAPLVSNTMGGVVVREDYQTAQLIALILELLSFCVEHHTFHIKNYIIHRDLLKKVLVLIKSKHTFLKLSSIRFLRKIIGMKDEFYNRHIESTNLFSPIVDALQLNKERYNLLDSAILEIFEFIKNEDMKILLLYAWERFQHIFINIRYVQTFTAMRIRYNQHIDKQREREKSTAAVESLGGVVRLSPAGSGNLNSGRFRRDDRELDKEEELWFGNDDDCDDDYDGGIKMKDSSDDSLEDEERSSRLLDMEGMESSGLHLHHQGTATTPGIGSPAFGGVIGPTTTNILLNDKSSTTKKIIATTRLIGCNSESSQTPEDEDSTFSSTSCPISPSGDTNGGDGSKARSVISSQVASLPGISLVAYDDNSDEDEEMDEEFFEADSAKNSEQSKKTPEASEAPKTNTTNSSLKEENKSEVDSTSADQSSSETPKSVESEPVTSEKSTSESEIGSGSDPSENGSDTSSQDSKSNEEEGTQVSGSAKGEATENVESTEQEDEKCSEKEKSEDEKSAEEKSENEKKVEEISEEKNSEEESGEDAKSEAVSEAQKAEVISEEVNTKEENTEESKNQDDEKRKREDEEKISSTANGLEEGESEPKKPRLETS